jgi:hypothetical protein
MDVNMHKSHLPTSFPFFKSTIDAPLSFSQGLGDESPNGSNKNKVERKINWGYISKLYTNKVCESF